MEFVRKLWAMKQEELHQIEYDRHVRQLALKLPHNLNTILKAISKNPFAQDQVGQIIVLLHAKNPCAFFQNTDDLEPNDQFPWKFLAMYAMAKDVMDLQNMQKKDRGK